MASRPAPSASGSNERADRADFGRVSGASKKEMATPSVTLTPNTVASELKPSKPNDMILDSMVRKIANSVTALLEVPYL